ncbi:hypothetical protein FACS1894184_09910 [Clostridia bacterium]|nr:hypothetical protein FACS1894184_09910 [Clostridia bacterium]
MKVYVVRGYAQIQREYDELKNVIEERYYDDNDKLIAVAKGYAILRREFSEKLQTREAYFDIEKRAQDASKYPHIKRYMPMPEDLQHCSTCGEAFEIWYEDEPTYSHLRYKPGYFYYEDFYMPRGVCRHKGHDEHKGSKVQMVEAPIPTRVINNSIASPSLIAFILIEKYIKAVPYYRLEQTLIKSGIDDITQARMCSLTCAYPGSVTRSV